MSDGYAYGVARTHIKESELLNKQELEQMLTASTYEDAVQVLQDKGYASDRENMEEMLAGRREMLWAFMEELGVHPDIFRVFRHETDFHNLKTAIKAQVLTDVPDEFFLDSGNIPIEIIKKAVKDKDFVALPKRMADAGSYALDLLLRTRDGQGCDMVIDRAALETMYEDGMQSEIPVIRDWTEWKVAAANIKIAVRCCLTEKPVEFITRALAECATLDHARLALAATKDIHAVYEYLAYTPYAGAIEALKNSLSNLEKWFDDAMMERLRTEKTKNFGLEPIVAYMLAVENEMKQVRLILTGKRNFLDESLIRERMRELYG